MSAPNYSPTPEDEAARERHLKPADLDAVLDLAESWRPVDLTDALARRASQAPTILVRVDGEHLVYPGRVHWILGEPESLKSWLAQFAAAQQLIEGRNVLLIDYEDNEHDTVGRLLDLGVEREAVAAHLAYVHPAITVEGVAELVLAEVLASREWHLIVLDGVTESLAIEGLDGNDNGDIAEWLRRLPKRCARTGAAVIAIDHVAKAVEGRGRFAIGAQHKLAGVDGTSLAVQVVRPLARADNEPVEGAARLVLGKDRPGHVRRVSHERKYAGTFEVTAYPDGTLAARIVPEVAEIPPPPDTVKTVVAHLDTYPRATESHLIRLNPGEPPTTLLDALGWLVAREWVAVEPSGNTYRYSLTDLGRTEWQA